MTETADDPDLSFTRVFGSMPSLQSTNPVRFNLPFPLLTSLTQFIQTIQLSLSPT